MNGNEGVKMENRREALVYMSGYLPGVSPKKSPMLSLEPVQFPDPMDGGDSWKDVCGGGCGFAMAISGLILQILADCGLVCSPSFQNYSIFLLKNVVLID